MADADSGTFSSEEDNVSHKNFCKVPSTALSFNQFKKKNVNNSFISFNCLI